MLESRSAQREFAERAAAHRRAGRLADAERELHAGLVQQPNWAEGLSLLTLVLLEQDRVREAREILANWARALDADAPVADDSHEPFAREVSDDELEVAFDAAETNPDEVFDADAIAQRAMRETDFELEEIASADSMFATRTVAELLEQQGDELGASRIRAMAESSTPVSSPSGGSNRNNESIEQLERWLVNLRGGAR